MKVFLGGTCNGSKWREKVINKLECDYYNPVVPVWNDEARLMEEYQKTVCTVNLYVITPLMTGVYSIAEVVDDSNKRPEKTLLCVLDEDEGKKWTLSQKHSLECVKKLVMDNGVAVSSDLDEVISFLNRRNDKEDCPLGLIYDV